MPFVLSLVLTLFLFIQPPVTEKAGEYSIDPVISAIQKGSSSDLAEYFDSSISLNLNGQQGDYSKNQAELVVKDFFKKNPSTGFSLVFQSENSPTLSSYIGDYQSGRGSFKVFIKASSQGSSLKIYSLEFVRA